MRLNREILRLAIPSILANITVPLVGMVDIAVAGHMNVAGNPAGLSAAAFIGAIAVGTTLFDLLYWNFAFLRSGTGGLTAQAYGRGDNAEAAKILYRALSLALGIALILIAIQWFFVQFAFLFMRCSPQVRELASAYFYLRIWAAPATLSLMAFKGWFIGMQNSVAAMSTDLTVNGVNIVASIVLSHWLGFKGIALGTVTAQYCGVLTAIGFLLFKYRKVLHEGRSSSPLKRIRDSFHGSDMSRFFSINRDIFIRSLCFIAIYIGYTAIAAPMGDILLSVSAILMKILMLFSFFTDGFAYAGEALTGRFIGAREPENVRATVKWVFIWSMGIAVLFIGIYGFGGHTIAGLMTKDAEVLETCMEYIPWLLLMPPFGCAAFAWDGIFIGATATKGIRNAMIAAAVSFFSVWGAGMLLLKSISGETTMGSLDLHILMAAYFAHLLARTIYLSKNYKKSVLTLEN